MVLGRRLHLRASVSLLVKWKSQNFLPYEVCRDGGADDEEEGDEGDDEESERPAEVQNRPWDTYSLSGWRSSDCQKVGKGGAG